MLIVKFLEISFENKHSFCMEKWKINQLAERLSRSSLIVLHFELYLLDSIVYTLLCT